MSINARITLGKVIVTCMLASVDIMFANATLATADVESVY